MRYLQAVKNGSTLRKNSRCTNYIWLMKVIIAPDKFKHSLTSIEACKSIQEGLACAMPGVHTTLLPMADGGDGLLEALSFYSSAQRFVAEVSDPLSRKITASYLISDDGETAFLEMAKASGLMLLKPEEYNPEITSTFGTGELIKHAISKGVKKIILGIGGSATNDAGIGMAAALDFRFLDKNHKVLSPIGKNLGEIAYIEPPTLSLLSNITFELACDVKNPLTGETGASKVYAAQKGADSLMIERLESGMRHFAKLVKEIFGKDVRQIPGAGAAGGLGVGCLVFLNATLKSGVELVFEYSKAEVNISNADLVISGEGKLDEQSLQGKVVSGLTGLCKKYNKPLIVFCGKLELSEAQLKDSGITAYCINDEKPATDDNLFKNAYGALRAKVADVFRD